MTLFIELFIEHNTGAHSETASYENKQINLNIYLILTETCSSSHVLAACKRVHLLFVLNSWIF